MRYSVIILLFFITSISLAQEADSGDRTPKYSNEFLHLGVGARALGMSQSVVSNVSDVSSGYWNPAGLLALTTNQGVLMHASYFGGLANYDYGAYAFEYDENSKAAFSVIRFSVDNIPDTRFLFDADGTINYDNIRFFAAADYAFLASYARRLNIAGGLNAGGSVKIILRTVGEFSKAWGFGFDVGVQKKIGSWNLGASMRDALGTYNAWSHNVAELEDVFAITGNTLPQNSIEISTPRLIIGASRNFSFSDNLQLTSSVDLDFTFDGQRNTLISSSLTSIDPRTGFELAFKQQFFLRAGIGQFQQIEDFEGAKSWTFQPTVGLGFDLGEVTLDYAMTDAFNVAPGLYSHVFSINIDFKNEE